MKISVLAALSFATIAVAAPADDVVEMSARTYDKRQACNYGFVFARGSTEPSPLVCCRRELTSSIFLLTYLKGILIGPKLQSQLRAKLPGLRTFPVLYSAQLATNVSPARTDPSSISKGVAAFRRAQGCRVIVAGGYSQGAAVMHNVVGRSLDARTKAKIAGVALFGDTRNKQDRAHIPNFPKERSRVWCKVSDGVCGGQLLVNAGHLSYSAIDISQAATWLAGRARTGR
jgi:cutinase